MRTTEDAALVAAAQRGERGALDELASAYLPLVYNIVGRAMNGDPEVDDVVQETMLRAFRGLRGLRDPAAFRSWLVAIAVRQVRDAYGAREGRADALAAVEPPSPDFAETAIMQLGLTGQRQETVAATRWLDEDDAPVLALWWQEAAGLISRAELAGALELPPAHAAVRVARMKERLAMSRTLVRALDRVPRCPELAAVTAGWDQRPSPLWRKRLARHVRDCPWCLFDADGMVPAERLIHGLPLVAVPAALIGALGRHTLNAHKLTAHKLGTHQPGVHEPGRHKLGGHNPGGGRKLGAHRLLPKALASSSAKIAIVVVVVAAGAAAGMAAVTHATASSMSTPATLTLTHAPVVKPAPSPKRTPTAKPTPKPAPKPTPTPKATPAPAAAPPATLDKGVGAWNFTGVTQALADSGSSWYYDWGTTPNGITAPASASFVPMIWGAASVTAANLAEVKTEGSYLLGFNEPDMAAQSNMTVAQALDLWPQLEATGMTLGSPAVASDAATPGGWLDQFMSGARARGYRVNFITVHWYGGDFVTADAVQELESYLQAIYARYHLPIWLTEFALTNYSGSTPTYPTDAQQAAFLTAATSMLATLPYVQRYAWFALPVSSGSGTTGLFGSGAVATEVGRAFEAAP
jgi:RNA polymerase sigma factor (sigma-70 family)